MELSKEKIAAIVVTFNRKNLLDDCLQAIFKQTRPLDSIIIIDNASTDGTPEFLKEKGYLNNPLIDYVRLSENTGGAGGFHEGMKRGYEKGFDWLWLMDDDVMPNNDCLEHLLHINNHFRSNGIDKCVLLPIRLYLNGEFHKCDPSILNFNNPFIDHKQKYINTKHLEYNEFIPIQCFPFEGPLISKELIEIIGYPDKKFFIYGDDTDYSIRILKKNIKIFLIKKAILNKIIKPTKNRNFDWRNYYYFRNCIVLDRKYGNYLVKNIRPIFYYLIKLLLTCTLKMRRIHSFKIVLRAFIDGWNMKMGKTINPGKI